MGFYAENRPEFIITELACISDSIASALIPIRSMEHETLEMIIDQIELQTLCVSKYTLSQVIKNK
jgi:long-subunit acyl-CoA synthetase (AMP-forming)